MMRMVSRWADENFGTAATSAVIGLAFIVGSFILFGVTTSNEAKAQAAQQQAVVDQSKNKIFILDKDGRKVEIPVGYKVADQVPGFTTRLTCKNNDGKAIIDEVMPMGTHFKNNPQHITTINNKGNRLWIVPVGNLTCFEEEIKD